MRRYHDSRIEASSPPQPPEDTAWPICTACGINPLVTDEDRDRGVCTPCHQAGTPRQPNSFPNEVLRKKQGMSNLVTCTANWSTPPPDYDQLRDLYENRRRYNRDNRMPLTCTQPHAGQMHLRSSTANCGPPTTPAKAPATS